MRAYDESGYVGCAGRRPPEITLVQEAGFAKDTVRKAMAVPIEENRLYVVRVSRSFVRLRPGNKEGWGKWINE